MTGTKATATITGNSSSIHGLPIGIDVNGGSASITNNAIYDNGIGVRVTNAGVVTAFSGNNFVGAPNPNNGIDLQLTATTGLLTMGAGNLVCRQHVSSSTTRAYRASI